MSIDPTEVAPRPGWGWDEAELLRTIETLKRQLDDQRKRVAAHKALVTAWWDLCCEAVDRLGQIHPGDEHRHYEALMGAMITRTEATE